MTPFTQLQSLFFSKNKKHTSLNASTLRGHDEYGKQEALDAIDILLEYKSTVHEFTDEIIAHWSTPQKIMDRYEIDDVEQLNEWLDSLGGSEKPHH